MPPHLRLPDGHFAIDDKLEYSQFFIIGKVKTQAIGGGFMAEKPGVQFLDFGIADYSDANLIPDLWCPGFCKTAAHSFGQPFQFDWRDVGLVEIPGDLD
jgi:hypothetical protein